MKPYQDPWIRVVRSVTIAVAVLLTTPALASQLSLSWTDNSSDESGFTVERSPISSTSYAPVATVGTDVTTYVDTTVTGGQGYCYRVMAFNSAGSSAYSNAVCATAPNDLPTAYTLTVARTGTGSGTVTGPGVNCGTDCSEPVASGNSVTLTAAATTGSTFTGWSGGGCSGTGTCTTTVLANTTVTATFGQPTTYTLTVTRTGTGSGTVTGPGVNCGADCSESVAGGTTVTLAAAPTTGSYVSGWSGACGGPGVCTVSVSANTVVGAAFASSPPAGTPEIVTGTEPGSPPRVLGLTSTGHPTTTNFLAYSSSFTGGVFVALGRLGSQDEPLIVTGSGPGMSAEVRAFRRDGSVAGASFQPYGKSFKGGVRIAACDLDGDGVDEIVTVPGPGYWPTVSVWELGARRASRLLSFNAGSFRNVRGLFVACGDVDGDGVSEIVVGNDQGATPEVRVYRARGSKATLIASDLAYEPSFAGGVRVATADVDGDGIAEIITAPGAGSESFARVLKVSGTSLTEVAAFEPEGPGFAAGLFIAGGKRHDLGGAVVATSPGPGGPGHIRIFSVSPAGVLESATATTGPSGVTLGASP